MIMTSGNNEHHITTLINLETLETFLLFLRNTRLSPFLFSIYDKYYSRRRLILWLTYCKHFKYFHSKKISLFDIEVIIRVQITQYQFSLIDFIFLLTLLVPYWNCNERIRTFKKKNYHSLRLMKRKDWKQTFRGQIRQAVNAFFKLNGSQKNHEGSK